MHTLNFFMSFLSEAFIDNTQKYSPPNVTMRHAFSPIPRSCCPCNIEQYTGMTELATKWTGLVPKLTKLGFYKVLFGSPGQIY